MAWTLHDTCFNLDKSTDRLYKNLNTGLKIKFENAGVRRTMSLENPIVRAYFSSSEKNY